MRRFAPSGRLAPPGACGWTVLILVLGAFRSFCLPNALRDLGAWRGAQEEKNVRIGLLLKENSDPGASVAHFWAGAAAYFSERPAQDMLGKNDPRLARMAGRPGQWQPGHTKYDPAYSLSLEPDVIVTASPAAFLDPAVRRADPGRDSYPALQAIYDEPDFQRLYAPGLVPLPVSVDFHAIFVRAQTPRARPPAQWKDVP
jgi:hypothetical protein